MLGIENNLDNFGTDSMSQGSKRMKYGNQSFPGEDCTIDLLRLSSQLEGVEYQKKILQANTANDVSFCLSIT